MEKYQSTKIFDGYSTVFRQWKAKDTHCQFLHGYGVSLKRWFESNRQYGSVSSRVQLENGSGEHLKMSPQDVKPFI